MQTWNFKVLWFMKPVIGKRLAHHKIALHTNIEAALS